MTPELVTLAHRAVACKSWRWMPGMMRLRVTPPVMRDYLRQEGRVPDGGDDWSYSDWPVIPDLTDPATLGCFLALVRDVYGAETWIMLDDGAWSVWTRQDGWHRCAALGWSEVEALVHALEQASGSCQSSPG